MSTDLLEQAFASTAGVLANVKADQLDDPTPCASWKVRDLINHFVGGTFFFAVVAETGAPPSTSDAPPDFASEDFVQAFDDGSNRAVAAFRAEGAMDKQMTLPFGQMAGSVFVNIAATDAFVHGWDLAKATGQSTDLAPQLATALLERARTFVPDAMRGADTQAAFGPQVAASAGAHPADQLAAFLGRTP